MEESLAQILRRDGSRGSQPALAQAGPKRGLAVPVFGIHEQARRTFGVLSQQEHQTGETSFASGLELQLRVGKLRLVSYRGSVQKPNDGHIDIGGLYCLATHLRGLEVTRGEVRHITDDVSCTRHRSLRSLYKRPTDRDPP